MVAVAALPLIDPTIVELKVLVPPIVWFPVVYTPFVTVSALPVKLPTNVADVKVREDGLY